jgi:hypothetical protein
MAEVLGATVAGAADILLQAAPQVQAVQEETPAQQQAHLQTQAELVVPEVQIPVAVQVEQDTLVAIPQAVQE